MSLRFDLTEIPNYKEACFREAKDSDGVTIVDENGDARCSMSPTTDYIVMMTMFIGMPCITEENAQEFFHRSLFYEKVFDSFHVAQNGKRLLTPQDISSHIGLRTNSSRLSKAEFLRSIWSSFERESPKVDV